jgi:hypothetical protein
LKHRLFFLMAGIAVLGQSVGCMYPGHDQGRRPRPEQRRDQDHEQRHATKVTMTGVIGGCRLG